MTCTSALLPGGDEQARNRCGPSPLPPEVRGDSPRRPQETVHPRQQEQHGGGLECAGAGRGRPGELEGGAQRRLRCCEPRAGCMGAPHREDERCAWVTGPPRAQLPRRAAVSPWASPQTIGSMLAARVAVVRPGPGWGQAGRDCAPWGSVRAVFASAQRAERLGFAAKGRDPLLSGSQGQILNAGGPRAVVWPCRGLTRRPAGAPVKHLL